MPIKIDCKSCGFKNDLGRVFCVQCGKRLELTNTSLEELAARRQIDWGRYGRQLVRLLIVLVIAGVVAAFFWRQAPATVQVDPAGAQQVPYKIKAVQSALRARQAVSLSFSEAELNGYLEARAKARRVTRLTIDLKPGAFELAAWHDWAPATNVAALTNVVFPVSCSIAGGFDKGHFVVKGGRFGHVPLPGPAGMVSLPWFRSWFSDVFSQTGLVGSIKSVTLDDAKADLVFGP